VKKKLWFDFKEPQKSNLFSTSYQSSSPSELLRTLWSYKSLRTSKTDYWQLQIWQNLKYWISHYVSHSRGDENSPVDSPLWIMKNSKYNHQWISQCGVQDISLSVDKQTFFEHLYPLTPLMAFSFCPLLHLEWTFSREGKMLGTKERLPPDLSSPLYFNQCWASIFISQCVPFAPLIPWSMPCHS
jgi:hypothetical protein